MVVELLELLGRNFGQLFYIFEFNFGVTIQN